jgi:anaerobic C4-dicarboxylate transporter DcuA
MLWLDLAIVLAAIVLGGRLGGVGLGAAAAIGIAILVFVRGAAPGIVPVDVLLIILTVITAVAAMQAAGGLDVMVGWAATLLRARPAAITIVAPLVCWLFTFVAGTGHVAYAVLPVIAETARKAGIRPERPLSIAVIASQQAITASPVAAATAGLLALFAGGGNGALGLGDILLICVPATLIGVLVGAAAVWRMGDDLPAAVSHGSTTGMPMASDAEAQHRGLTSIVVFLLGVGAIIVLGLFPSLRPAFGSGDTQHPLSMTAAIQIIMLVVAALIMLRCRVKPAAIANGTVMQAGIVAVIAIIGLGWLGSTFFEHHRSDIEPAVSALIKNWPLAFAGGLFVLSILLYSQAATVSTLMPVGIALGLPQASLIAMFPAVNGYFFLPTYGTLVAAMQFDRTGTTTGGTWLLNHSFMRAGLVATTTAVLTGLGLAALLY